MSKHIPNLFHFDFLLVFFLFPLLIFESLGRAIWIRNMRINVMVSLIRLTIELVPFTKFCVRLMAQIAPPPILLELTKHNKNLQKKTVPVLFPYFHTSISFWLFLVQKFARLSCWCAIMNVACFCLLKMKFFFQFFLLSTKQCINITPQK